MTQGNFVTGGLPGSTLLTTLVSIDPIYVSFEGDEQLYLRYQKATLAGGGAARTVAMGLANEDGFPRSGKLDFIDNRLDPKTGTIRVRAVFPNADRFLTPGLFARIKLLSGRTYRATMVSDRAVGTDQSPKFLLVVGDNNALQYRPVKLGGTANGLRIIQEGLRPGERIVVNGLQRVRPGAIVQPQMVAMDADPNAPTASAPKPATNAAPEGAPSKPPSGVEIKKGADAAK